MADDTTEAIDPPGTDDQRLDRLEDGQREMRGDIGAIKDMLAKVLPTHAQAQQHTEEHLDRGSSVAEQVKAELARAKEDEARAAADAEAAESERSEREELRALAARLKEKPPAPPRNPIKALATKGWGDG